MAFCRFSLVVKGNIKKAIDYVEASAKQKAKGYSGGTVKWKPDSAAKYKAATVTASARVPPGRIGVRYVVSGSNIAFQIIDRPPDISCDEVRRHVIDLFKNCIK